MSDAGRPVVPQHDEEHSIPDTELGPGHRRHNFNSDCWCKPEVVVVVRQDDGTICRREIAHRASGEGLRRRNEPHV